MEKSNQSYHYAGLKLAFLYIMLPSDFFDNNGMFYGCTIHLYVIYINMCLRYFAL